MSTALITGVSGQDGSYLAEQLIAKGYRVLGGVRDVSRASDALPMNLREGVELVAWDMSDLSALQEVIATTKPTEIYNFAAYASGAAMFEDPLGMAEVNGVAVTRILEAIRAVNPKIKFCQASSREIFGEALESPQTESTPPSPRSPYGAAKLYADAMIRIYRHRYGMYACSAILFNHESPRRSVDFVTRKISREAARIKLGLSQELHLGNLDTQRDWGFAGDYVHAMWLMMQKGEPEDYVVATGVAHSVREFCDQAFAHVGLDYRDHVREDAASYRPSEPAPLVGSPAKAWRNLGWKPEVSFPELVHMMVDSDLRDLRFSMNN
ncbi:MAG: GDP-mannose 4,6-dehydratase [Hydrogenophaga sp.]|uniref:GDP-mannose 4,6-dehydratase n=1 Tax=Hydrogenophaga sp. TaxID=1904254 RepID=UPI00261F95C4|nr:GDP-mannose 4,6-dehydratase [Hydrogenophaga sp.]MDM7943736.1 GDP-mannose 4,6-dehydratase [Hydrogenophaga sp.]